MARLTVHCLVLIGWSTTVVCVCAIAFWEDRELSQFADETIDHREIVRPRIIGGNEVRPRRSTNDEEPLCVLLKNWTLETRINDRLIVSPKFVSRWVSSEKPKSWSKKRKVIRRCEVRHGFVRNEESVVALTLCKDEMYGLVQVGVETFFLQPLTKGQHVLYKPKSTLKWESEREFGGLVSLRKSRLTRKENKVEGIGTFDFESIANLGIDDLFLQFYGNDFARIPNIEVLERVRDYIDDILTHENLNKSGENEIPTKASGLEGAGLEVGFADGMDLHEKLEKEVVARSFDQEEMEVAIYGSHKRAKRDSMICNTKEFYNLTGDTIDVEGEENGNRGPEAEEKESEDARLEFEEDSERIGYFFDRAWERDKLPRRKSLGKEASPRWLELGIAADHSVIDFHGARVQRYILALFNIVSAIYKDPSLESNVRLVIVQMIFYAEKENGMVRSGNARRSLENVNRWNRRFLSSSNVNHDVAVWLTRLDIGGPSGYAPVSGACDPARSCALNRDEGLTSAFIIAHEVAHILGLTHDGDESAGNTCSHEGGLGSVMAPMVSATFHRFHWSTCSRKEFHHRTKQWFCLLNEPNNNSNATYLKAIVQEAFTMDEQCRMEFGEGYELCRSFDLPEPCSHLWCGHFNSSQVCKTKKGPPLEGTVCGQDKWCINGYCEPVDRKRFRLGPVVHNARDGGWSAWTSWGRCSSSCGIAVQFRTRKCNGPTPAYGGSRCKGKSEEFRICEQSKCLVGVDLRSQQCLRLASIAGFKDSSPWYNMTWLPYEPDQESVKCQLACRSKQTGEVFLSEENLIDGSPCSYGSTDICVQGKCWKMGCDSVLGSERTEDNCGVCDGNDSTCNDVTNKSLRKLRRTMTRMAVIPRGAYNVRVDVTIVEAFAVYMENATIAIRDGKRRRNDVGSFDARGRGQMVIVEGAAFRPQKLNNTYTMWARGPLFAEIIVSLAVSEEAVKHGSLVSIFSRYTVDRNDENATARYNWLPGGWGPCTVSCGGGTRQKTIACKDETTQRIVSRRKCSIVMKPVRETERCNLFGCNFKWLPGPWEGCSRTCGSTGIQYRQLYCVPSSFDDKWLSKENELEVFGIMVPPKRCGHPPESERDCNRVPCQGHWVFTDWSSCSQSCGRGVQSRMARCVPPNGESFFNCTGSLIPDELRPCGGRGRRSTDCSASCRNDRSEYCALPNLSRYCEVPGFRRRCCRTCEKESSVEALA